MRRFVSIIFVLFQLGRAFPDMAKAFTPSLSRSEMNVTSQGRSISCRIQAAPISKVDAPAGGEVVGGKSSTDQITLTSFGTARGRDIMVQHNQGQATSFMLTHCSNFRIIEDGFTSRISLLAVRRRRFVQLSTLAILTSLCHLLLAYETPTVSVIRNTTAHNRQLIRQTALLSMCITVAFTPQDMPQVTSWVLGT